MDGELFKRIRVFILVSQPISKADYYGIIYKLLSYKKEDLVYYEGKE